MSSGKVATIVAIVAFVVLLLWSTLSAQRVECEVCVEFQGRRNCATASAATEDEAARSAQTTACGTLAGGMAETVFCSNATPTSRRCARR
ncbi:MAG: hypothetical protein E4H37_06710 [Gemmatimonadales bacterium]|jgi:hypothetical protein|nr:MAG: hypothetical protein E4H37_06710 [Gemmatimonadales bacterium]